MTIEPIIFFDLVAAIFILVIGLTVFAFLYARLLNKLHLAKKEEDHLKEQLNQKATVLLETARDKAFQIINQAGLSALEIVGKTKVYDNKAKQALDLKLKDISDEFLIIYKEMLEELKRDNINIFKIMSKDIEKDTLDEVKDFKEILCRETLASQKIVEEKIEKEYAQAEEELKAYKEAKLRKIDDSIYEILKTISKIVLGKAIPLEEHEQLIIEALNRAKKEGVFK